MSRNDPAQELPHFRAASWFCVSTKLEKPNASIESLIDALYILHSSRFFISKYASARNSHTEIFTDADLGLEHHDG